MLAAPSLAFQPAAPPSFAVCTVADSGRFVGRALCFPCLDSLVSCYPCFDRSFRCAWIQFVADGAATTDGVVEKDVLVVAMLLDCIVAVHVGRIVEIAEVAEEVVPTPGTTWDNHMAKVVLQKGRLDLKDAGASDLGE